MIPIIYRQSVFETLSHHKVGQFQPICPAFLILHYFVSSLLEERTSRQAHFRSNFRDSVFPGSLFYGQEQQTPDADLLIILVHKQRVQIAFGIHRRKADDFTLFVQCRDVVIASQQVFHMLYTVPARSPVFHLFAGVVPRI